MTRLTNLVQFPGLGLSFELNRVAFSIGRFNVYWYGVCIAFGICLALVFAFRHSVEFGVDADSMVDVILIGIVLGIASARAYYVAMAPFKYESIWEMIAIRDGGLAIYGGIIGGFLFGGLACKWRGVPVLPMFDLTAMGFLLGQCCGRWGNFFNQEAFGCNTTLPWGMYSEATRDYLMGSTVTAQSGVTIDPNLPVHPTFLYESIWCLVGFILLFRYIKKRKFNGDIALRYMIWYGAGRFWIEALRTDSLMLVPSIGLRSEGVREWNYTTNLHQPGGMQDRDLLAAAAIACQAQVWDRCINTSERTKSFVSWQQRYPMPFKDEVVTRARTIGLDPAYVYGLIRQESRFIMDARSHVGASGLMQVMPATAKWTAKKIGMTDFQPSMINQHDVNITIGTAYLKLALDDFDGSMALAAAGYNAGPGRPRNWRNGPVLDAAIWAENVPFTETRDYVKKVLANTTNYAAAITGQPQSLRSRLGLVGPKNTPVAYNKELP